MTREKQAIGELRQYDHAFLTSEGVWYFANAFNLNGKINPYLAKANPEDMKGLTLENGAKQAVGMDATILAKEICLLLGIKCEVKMGRGSQLRACCDALEAHFKS